MAAQGRAARTLILITVMLGGLVYALNSPSRQTYDEARRKLAEASATANYAAQYAGTLEAAEKDRQVQKNQAVSQWNHVEGTQENREVLIPLVLVLTATLLIGAALFISSLLIFSFWKARTLKKIRRDKAQTELYYNKIQKIHEEKRQFEP